MRALLGLLILFVACDATRLDAQSDVRAAPEYNVKAGYLRVFTRYVEWPPSTFALATTPITIGILGDDPFGDTLDKTLADATSQGRTLAVRRIRTVEDASGCHIIFISREAGARQTAWLAELRGRPALTVVESRSGGEAEAVVTFVAETVRGEKKVRFDIDLAAAESAGITIASPMLVAAREVRKNAGTKGNGE